MRPPADLVVILEKHKQMTALNKGELAEDLAAILAEEVRADFDAERAPDGTPWPELSDRYGAWKSEHYPGLPMGHLHGKLKAAIEDISNGVRIVFDRMYIEFAKGDEELKAYARAFNDGVPERNQPAREFLNFSERCKERMSDRIRQHIANGLRGDTDG